MADESGNKILKVLRAINNLPVRLTIKHWETFGAQTTKLKSGVLDSPEAWDALRREHPHFSVSPNREEWLEACEIKVKKDGQDGGLLLRARQIGELLRQKGIKKVFSIGVGGAALEYQIKKSFPEIKMVCSEYAPDNVELLRRVFLEADDIIPFDMKGADWSLALSSPTEEKTLALMYRIDPHATDKEWREIFGRMRVAGVTDILFIPCGFLTLRSIFQRKWRAFRLRLKGQPVVFSGYLRTYKTFESFWSGLYKAEKCMFGDFTGYYLQLA